MILLTGATGRIGKVVLTELLRRGFSVRATTRDSARAGLAADGALEWRAFDFATDTDFDALVAGCQAVIHLAAELGNLAVMERCNAEATARLAAACERQGVAACCYVSTVSVYGSAARAAVDETSPVLTTDRDVRSEYWALDYVRLYGRSKLKGELAIRAGAQRVHYVILRPAVVVSVDDLIAIRDWPLGKRLLAAHRHAHHIYVGDVADAIIWAVGRGLGPDARPGTVELFNLAEDDRPQPRHADFMGKAAAVSTDRRWRVPALPWFGDWLHDFLRFHSLPLRHPLWSMRFSSERLRQAGYRLPFGMAYAEQQALQRLAAKAESSGR